MDSNSNTATDAGTAGTPVPKGAKRQTILQAGIDRLRDPTILDDCKNRLLGLAEIIKANNTLSFDVVYADIP